MIVDFRWTNSIQLRRVRVQLNVALVADSRETHGHRLWREPYSPVEAGISVYTEKVGDAGDVWAFCHFQAGARSPNRTVSRLGNAVRESRGG